MGLENLNPLETKLVNALLKARLALAAEMGLDVEECVGAEFVEINEAILEAIRVSNDKKKH